MEPAPVVRSADVERWDMEAAVVVVGQGISGTCAAIEVAEAGASVIVLDSAGGGGGASSLSEGIIFMGGGTPVQRDTGYQDDVENFTRFMLRSTEGTDPDLVKLFCAEAPAHCAWLEERGVPFERTAYEGKRIFNPDTTCLLYTGNEKAWPLTEVAFPAPHGHCVAGPNGSAAMNPLVAHCAKVGAQTLYDARAKALVIDDEGRVVGLRARTPAGTILVRGSAGVILATGMFNNNRKLVAEFLTQLTETSRPLRSEHCNGDGLRLGVSAGAELENMGGYIALASIYPPEDLIKGIVINSRGERLVNEDVYHGRLAAFIAEQPDKTAYLILDENTFAYPEFEAPKHRLVGGFETIAEMAAGLDIPESSLRATLEGYNADATSGRDAEHHKKSEWVTPLNPPYAVFDISFNKSKYFYTTLGGIKADRHGRALNGDGQPIPGLYAVGAVAAALPRSGKWYASGLSLGPGSFFGRQAGLHAAAQALAANMGGSRPGLLYGS